VLFIQIKSNSRTLRSQSNVSQLLMYQLNTL